MEPDPPRARFLSLFAAAVFMGANARAADSKPNVVIMLADNLGFGDLGCYGSGGEIRRLPTPRIDKLAGEGLRFTQFFCDSAIFDIERDPREEWNMGGTRAWVAVQYMRVVGEYLASLKDYPNPPGFSMIKLNNQQVSVQ